MAAVKKARKDLKNAKADYKASKSVSAKGIVDKKKKALQRLEEQLTKLEVNLTDKVRIVILSLQNLCSDTALAARFAILWAYSHCI